MCHALVVLLLLLLFSPRPFRQTATVLSIMDGDTMRVVDAG
jgi:hypothetical protein